MEYTEGQKVQFKADFATRKWKQRVLTVPLIVLVLGIVLFSDGHRAGLFGVSPEIWGPVFFLLIAGAVVFSFLNWKCPACNKYLGKNTNPKFCSRCGVELQ